MTTEEQAKKLAEWLEQNPGSPPPEGIDREVLEAIYAIRPDLAPAPQVDLDTILGHISTGPFSASAENQSSRRESKSSRSRTIWAGFGSLAAAAAVLLIALPQQEDIGHIGPQLTPPVTRPAEPDRLDRTIVNEAEEGPSLPVQAPEETLQTQKALPIPEPNRAVEPAPESAPPPAIPEQGLDLGGQAMPSADQIGTISGSSDSANFSAGALSAGGESPTARGYGTASTVSGSSARASSEASVEADDFEEDELMEEEVVDEPLRATESNDSAARKAFGFLERSGRSNNRTRAAAPAAQMVEAAPAPQDETAASEPEETPASYLESLQSRAAPSDYQAPQFTASENLEPWQIQWHEAEKALQILNSSAYSEALQTASNALLLSSQNTPARAMLYWIQGQAFIAMGQEDAAIDAFTVAIQLNAAR